jgi:hypothetical protein
LRCARLSFFATIWLAFIVFSGWREIEVMFASLLDQRKFLVGATPALFILGLSGIIQPWVYSVRSLLLGANLFAFGMYFGVFLGTVSWPWNSMTLIWFIVPAFAFGGSIRYVLRSSPDDGWGWASSESIAHHRENGAST